MINLFMAHWCRLEQNSQIMMISTLSITYSLFCRLNDKFKHNNLFINFRHNYQFINASLMFIQRKIWNQTIMPNMLGIMVIILCSYNSPFSRNAQVIHGILNDKFIHACIIFLQRKIWHKIIILSTIGVMASLLCSHKSQLSYNGKLIHGSCNDSFICDSLLFPRRKIWLQIIMLINISIVESLFWSCNGKLFHNNQFIHVSHNYQFIHASLLLIWRKHRHQSSMIIIIDILGLWWPWNQLWCTFALSLDIWEFFNMMEQVFLIRHGRFIHIGWFTHIYLLLIWQKIHFKSVHAKSVCLTRS